VLLAQRPPGKAMAGLWEFPGGKVDAGDASPEAALVRELREELGIAVDARDLTPLAFASHAYADFHLLMPLFGESERGRERTHRAAAIYDLLTHTHTRAPLLLRRRVPPLARRAPWRRGPAARVVRGRRARVLRDARGRRAAHLTRKRRAAARGGGGHILAAAAAT
jgi:mutator protein MutT